MHRPHRRLPIEDAERVYSRLNIGWQYAIPRVCHLQSENGALWDSIFRCKYAIFLVFTGLENF